MVGSTGQSECRRVHRRSVLALVSVATPISRAAGALTWVTNHLGSRTREQSSPPRKRRRRRRLRKSRRGRQRTRNRSANKTETVANRIPTNPGSPHTEQAIVGRVSELRTGDGAPPLSDKPFHRGREVVRGARYLGDLSFINILFVINISRVEASHPRGPLPRVHRRDDLPRRANNRTRSVRHGWSPRDKSRRPQSILRSRPCET